MRAVIQRVTAAEVKINGAVHGRIGDGFLVLLGVGAGDTDADMKYIADKIINLRVFSDDNGKMNLSLADVNGATLVISQFTLYGDCSHGRRPYFGEAMNPSDAERMYGEFVEYVRGSGIRVETGEFGADMKVTLTNDGPVTIILDSRKRRVAPETARTKKQNGAADVLSKIYQS